MFIDLNGIKFAYDEQGKGTPLLLIHGFPLNRHLWDSQVGHFSKWFRTITPDLRGHGESQAIPGPYSMEMLASDCKSLLDALNINEPVILCGLSMGGYISLAFIKHFPSRVAGLILAATRANADSLEAQQNRDKAIALAHQQGPAAIASSMLPKMFAPDTYQSSPSLIDDVYRMMSTTSKPGVLGALHGLRDRADSTSLLATSQIPTLIIHGSEDQLISPSIAQDMNAIIPGSSLSVIPQAGHLLNLERPLLFNQAVENFLLANFYDK